MPRFVRCIEGHVFDAESAVQCPTCGAAVERPAGANAAPRERGADAAPAPDPGPTSRSRSLMIAGAGLGAGAGAAALALVWLFILRPPQPPSSPAPPCCVRLQTGRQPEPPSPRPLQTDAKGPSAPVQQTQAAEPPAPPSPRPEPQHQAGQRADTDSPPSSEQQQALQRTDAAAQQAGAGGDDVASLASPQRTTAAETPLSDTLQATLVAARLNDATRRQDYALVRQLAEPLAARNDPLGLFEMAILHQNGWGGAAKDLRRARAEFRAAYQGGYVMAALGLGRLLEQGLGGPADLAAAKQLYVFAADNGISAAGGDVKRLHAEGGLGMTAAQAYVTLLKGAKGKARDRAAARLAQFSDAPSMPARCATGWLYFWGKSVATDPDKALELFRSGAADDIPLCELGMGTIASRGGPDFPHDDVAASVFLHLSIRHVTSGSLLDEVRPELATVEGRMSDADKTRAQELLGDLAGAAPAATASADDANPMKEAADAAARNKSRIHWFTNAETAIMTGMASNGQTPVVMFFAGPINVDAIIYSDAMVALEDKAVLLLITSRSRDAATLERKFGVAGNYPTVVIARFRLERGDRPRNAKPPVNPPIHTEVIGRQVGGDEIKFIARTLQS